MKRQLSLLPSPQEMIYENVQVGVSRGFIYSMASISSNTEILRNGVDGMLEAMRLVFDYFETASSEEVETWYTLLRDPWTLSELNKIPLLEFLTRSELMFLASYCAFKTVCLYLERQDPEFAQKYEADKASYLCKNMSACLLGRTFHWKLPGPDVSDMRDEFVVVSFVLSGCERFVSQHLIALYSDEPLTTLELDLKKMYSEIDKEENKSSKALQRLYRDPKAEYTQDNIELFLKTIEATKQEMHEWCFPVHVEEKFPEHYSKQ